VPIFDRERLDKYNRMLAYVWVGDVLVNRKLLEEGCAEVYRRAPNIRYFQEFLLLEQEAKKKGKGMWNEAARAQWKAPPRRGKK
jgi:micrococcal nuclease